MELKKIFITVYFHRDDVGDVTFRGFYNDLSDTYLYNFSNSVNMMVSTKKEIKNITKSIKEKHPDCIVQE